MNKKIEAGSNDLLAKIVEQLIAADSDAQKVYDTAVREQHETENGIEERKARIKEKYMERANARITEIKKDVQSGSERHAAEIARSAEENLQKLQQESEANLELWAEQIFQAVISD